MPKKESDKIKESIFKLIAPGQPLRMAIERIQEASLGGLLVFSSLEDIEKFVDAGFDLHTNFSPQKVYELAKMDGAVLISEDLKTIYGANIQLQPNKEVFTDESGTRHRTAHRMAQITNKLVITISERRKRVTVFKGKFKYTLDLIGDLLIKSSQAIMSLEKYAISVNKYLDDLFESEIENTVILEEVLDGLRYFYLMFTMDKEIKQYIMELGNEGRLLELQHYEIMANQKTAKQRMIDENISPKGYRILSEVNKLTKKDVENIVEKFKTLNDIFNANYDDIYSIKGMGKFKTDRVLKLKDKYKKIFL